MAHFTANRAALSGLAMVLALGVAPLAAHAEDGGTPLWRLHRYDRESYRRDEAARQDLHSEQARNRMLEHRQDNLESSLGGIRHQEAQVQDQLDGIHGHGNHHDRRDRLNDEEQQLQREAAQDHHQLWQTRRADAATDHQIGDSWWRVHHYNNSQYWLSREIRQRDRG